MQSMVSQAVNFYQIECFRDGKKIWEENIKNRVVNQGLNDILDKYFKGASYSAGHFMGLKGSGVVAAGHTLASHSGWSEVTAYSGNRQRIQLGSVSGQAVDNSANKCTFQINGTATVAGILVATIASGTNGVLFGAADFPSERNVLSGDTLIVTVTFTQQSA
jgi:hypothetical protein